MKKVIAIVGPTASGKSKLALELAKEFKTCIISADSVAVYKELDIGSAKPTKQELKEVKHYLIDIKEPNESYSVAECQTEARKIIDKEELSIICGGTGLYVCAIINEYEFKNEKRDLDFSLNYDKYSNEELYDILKEKDLKRALELHPNNRNRILRSLETIMKASSSLTEFKDKNKPHYDTFLIYLDPDRVELYKRINLRVDEMLNNGLLEEVISLYEKGIYPKAIGYQEWQDYFKGLKTKEEVIEEIKKKTRHLAKRQRTWFKNQTNAKFYEVDYNNFDTLISKIKEDVRCFLK